MTGPWRSIGVMGVLVMATMTGCGGDGGSNSPAPAEEPTGPAASVDALGDGEWFLVEFAVGELAPEEPSITLTYVDGKFAGSSGCNRYFAGVTEGEGDLEIAVGPAAGTMMMCPETVMEAEQRFLGILGIVQSYRLDGESLYLSYADGVAEMRFVKLPAETAE